MRLAAGHLASNLATPALTHGITVKDISRNDRMEWPVYRRVSVGIGFHTEFSFAMATRMT